MSVSEQPPPPDVEQEPRPSFRLTVTKREPAVRLLYPVTGLEPLSWSEDHRLSVCTSSNVSVLEQVCDIHSSSPELLLHRTSVPAPHKTCVLRVGPLKDVEQCRAKFARSKDPSVSQKFMLDRVFNPEGKALPPLQGYKYACWSPAGCDANGRCLLAVLTLDNRLTVNANFDRLQWQQLADLTDTYGERVAQSNYQMTEADKGAELEDFAEFERRHLMQTPVRMEWSGICTTQEILEDNTCRDVGTVLLAVLLENGAVAVWQFQLPVRDGSSIVSCNTIASGVESPSVLSWWEYEHSNRKMSGLIVGSSAGPVKIIPVNLKAVKGYFTLRQPVILWQEADRLPVHSIKCVALYHPFQKCSCSLVVAARGAYVFWCLLLISKAGLNVHNSHVTGLHSTPIVSMAVDRQNGTVYTCSVDGKVQQLVPVFTHAALRFEHQLIRLSEQFGAVRCHGIALSPYGAYLACVTSEGIRHGVHPVNRSFQVRLVALKTFEEAAAQLLETSSHNLFRQMDLADLVRWKVLKDKIIPQFVTDALEKKMEAGPLYFWRFRLFLLRIWYQSFKKTSSEAAWKPNPKEPKASKAEEEDCVETNRAKEEDCVETKRAEDCVETNRAEEEDCVETNRTEDCVETNMAKEEDCVETNRAEEEDCVETNRAEEDCVETNRMEEEDCVATNRAEEDCVETNRMEEDCVETNRTEEDCVETNRAGCSPAKEGLQEIQQKIGAVEAHLTREHMKRVLGEVYLHTGITEYTTIPTRGVCAYLLANKDSADRTAQVLIGHVEKKMNKQLFPEYCSLCKEVLPFTDSKTATCKNGHLWPRCFLTYQACQTLEYRRCLLHDSIARNPVPEDLEWIKRLLRGPCTLCDSPVF